MNRKITLLALVAFALPVSAFAQTCGSPIPLFPSQAYNADTTTAANSVGTIGPLPSPGNDAVYSFVANGMNSGESIAISATNYNWGVALTTSCGATIPLANFLQGASGGSGASGSLPLNNAGAALTDGTTYYVIVTNNPTDNTGPSGQLTMTTPSPLPVKLQKFSVK